MEIFEKCEIKNLFVLFALFVIKYERERAPFKGVLFLCRKRGVGGTVGCVRAYMRDTIRAVNKN